MQLRSTSIVFLIVAGVLLVVGYAYYESLASAPPTHIIDLRTPDGQTARFYVKGKLTVCDIGDGARAYMFEDAYRKQIVALYVAPPMKVEVTP